MTQGTNNIAAYFSKLHLLWDEFDALDPSPSDCPRSRDYMEFMKRQKLLQFLMELNESYEQARSQILMMILIPTMNKVYSMLIERESQRSMTNTLGTMDNVEMNALMTTKGRNMQQTRKNFNVQWDFCKMKGHARVECFKIIGYPSDFKPKKKYGENTVNIVVVNDNRKQDAQGSSYANTAEGVLNSEGIRGSYFTPKQYEQILKLLGKENVTDSSSNIAGNNS